MISVELLKAVFDWAAVVLVGLTFIAGAGALITGNILNGRQAAQLRGFNSSVTAAQTELAQQQERAATADARVVGLEKDAADAKASEGKVERELEAQKELTAKAQKDASDAAIALAKLKTPRNLTPEQQERITAAISQFGGTPYDLWVSTDSDSAALMGQIDSALRAGKWEFHSSGIIQFGGKAGIISETGVSVHLPIEMIHELEKPALALSAALKAEGIPQKTVYADGMDFNKDFDRTRIHIRIGSKPLN